MQVSAEIRWFWPGPLPADLAAWFTAPGAGVPPAWGGHKRDDVYLLDPTQTELGIRRRGDHPGVEVKGLVAVTPGGLAVGPFAGPVETWAKWTSQELQLPSIQTVRVTRTRWLRTFDTSGPKPVETPLGPDDASTAPAPPVAVCHVELVDLVHPAGPWWSLGLESYGPPASVEPHLWAVAAALTGRGAWLPPGGMLAGYPGWLSRLSQKARGRPPSPPAATRPRG